MAVTFRIIRADLLEMIREEITTEVPRHGTAIVIEDHRESGLGGRLPLVDQEHIENTVIRLPDRVGSIGFATMQEIDALLVGFRALVG
jgi:hypothetical protein